MIKKTEVVIKDLLECQMMLQKQLDGKDVMIDSKNQQIEILKEEIDFLESNNKKLSEGIRQLAKENEHMEKICMKQQALLDEFSKMMEIADNDK